MDVNSSARWLFRGGLVLDGSGGVGSQGDVLVRDGVIAEVGSLRVRDADRVIDLDGRVISPGFIDMHAHSDLQAIDGDRHVAKVMQGITTEVIGQDGLGYAPIRDAPMLADIRRQISGWNGDPPLDWSWRSVAEYLDAMRGRIRTNVAFLIGHGTLRMHVAGYASEPLEDEQMAAMAALASQGMLDGASGLSLGLTYAPGSFGSTEELVELCRTVAAHGGYLSPHHRNYGAGALEAYGECVEIARRSGIRLHLTHCLMNYPANAGRAGALLDLLDEARAGGVTVTMDSYPYLAGNTYLSAFLPSWAQRTDIDELRALLLDSDARSRIQQQMESPAPDQTHGIQVVWDAVVISGGSHPDVRALSGRSIQQIAAERNETPFEAFCRILDLDGTRVSCLNFVGHEENVQAIMRSPFHTIGTDAILVGDRPHPRGWGTIPRFLGRYVRDMGLFPLEEAIRKMTSLPASVVGLADRGLLKPGYRADLVCFDPETVLDRATYEDPMLPPVGIEHVMVNGELVVEAGAPKDRRPGEVLTRR